jgi:single-strand DNA-binding protein
MSTNVTLTGTLGRDPELRFTPAGKAVATLSVVTSKSVLNKDTDKWENEEETWWRVEVWEKMAENVAETLLKGDPVIVVGRSFMDKYTDKEGNERQSLRVNAYNVGLDLKRRTASVNRVKRESGSQGASRASGDAWGSGDAAPF